MLACRRYIRILYHDSVNRNFRRGIVFWRDDKPDRRGMSVLSLVVKYYGLDEYGVLVSH
jgi:hypothetical protein